jgi:hypothetical protein
MPARGLSARRALTLTGAVAVAALAAGCSSSPAVTPQAQVTAGRAAVLSVADKFIAQIAATGVAWSGGTSGGYQECGANDPLASPATDSSLQYTAQQLLAPFSRSVSYPVFKRQVVEALNGLGWSLKPATGGSSPATYYAGRHGNTDLRVIELDEPDSLGPTVTLYFSDACFNAGSSAAAQHYLSSSPDFNGRSPQPTATPTPQYS